MIEQHLFEHKPPTDNFKPHSIASLNKVYSHAHSKNYLCTSTDVMEDFIVSARKYRPQTFDSVVGQESITKTLLKAIEQNQLAQAFLFCGPRGVGKTTCARILARTVNAHAMGHNDQEEDYAFNIFELDAASNNSVDDIRSLIDQVRVPPQTGKYKVYIIDEVHMLSTAAFNAFLKTLEEPPSYAIFILATTEKHKVLPTIISRCQVFNFNRIQVPEMVGHLRHIAHREGIVAQDDALHVIAEKADGALRDALTIFDQMVSFAGNNVTYNDVIENLNVLDHDYYFGMVNSFLSGNRTDALLTLHNILTKGFDGHNFINGLANHFRNLLFSLDEATVKIMEVSENVKLRYSEQANSSSAEFLIGAINILSEADSDYKNSRNQRLLVELVLLKLCHLGTGAEKKNFDARDLNTSTSVSIAISESAPAQQLSNQAAEQKTIADQKVEPTHVSNQKSSEERSLEEIKSKPASPHHAIPVPETTPYVANSSDQRVESTTVQQHNGLGDTKPLNQNAPNDLHNVSEPNDAALNQKPPSKLAARLAKVKHNDVPSLKRADVSTNGSETIVSASQDEEEQQVGDAGFNNDRPRSPFNLKELWDVWDAYANTIKVQERQSYYATLTKRRPVQPDPDIKPEILQLVLDNKIQLGDLEADKVNLLGHLREALQNWHIQLEGIVEEDDAHDDIHLYTPEDRFKAMVQTNPSLQKLREQFDLDIEHD